MKKIIGLLLTIILISATTCVFAESTYNMKLKAETTEIEVGQEKIVFYIDLTQYSGDGILGYEGILEFDKDVFESALVESLNDWDKATYDTTTGKIISTTSDAESGKDIAKITLTLKNGINEDETEVKLNNFTLSDGNLGDTFNEKITYTFKKSAPTTNQTSTEGTNNQGNETTSGTTTRNTNSGTNNSEETTPTRNTSNEQNSANAEENNATPVETSVEESSKKNTETTTEENKKIETVGELKENDATTAQDKIPQTGSTAREIITVVVIAIAGVAGFIRFKTIKLK